MAGKFNPDPSRKSVVVPFADGYQDPRLGLAENVVLYTQIDKFNGDFKYFTQRPSYRHVQQLNVSGTAIGAPLDVMSDPFPNLSNLTLVATPSNLYRTSLSDTSGSSTAWFLPSIQLNDYQADIAAGRITKFIRFQNTAATNQNYVVVALKSGNIIVLTSSFLNPEYAIGFSPNNYGTYLDGYLFLAETDGDSIMNCALNDYTSWTPSVNYIRATQIPGKIVALCTIKNFVVALKEKSIEYFYNAGLNNTSPLQRNTSYTQQIGLSYKYSLAQHGDTIMFVGKETSDTELAVFYMDGLGAAKRVSTPNVESGISQLGTLYDTESQSYHAYFTKINGKLIYMLYVIDPLGANVQFAYDVSEDTWTTITSGKPGWWDTDPFTPGKYYRYPVTHSAVQNGTTYWIYDPSAIYSNTASTCVSVPDAKSKDYILGKYGGEYLAITAETKIPALDFGTGNRKQLHEMSLSVIAPDTINHSVSFVKTVGGRRQTITKTTVEGDNMNFKNWGQFVSGYVIYTANDPSYTAGANLQDTQAGLNMNTNRINSINMEISSGIS